jgi:hypothetical protein
MLNQEPPLLVVALATHPVVGATVAIVIVCDAGLAALTTPRKFRLAGVTLLSAAAKPAMEKTPRATDANTFDQFIIES